LIKRVIGMPGDSILIRNETVYVNGEKINEPYLGSATIGEVSIESIPDNEYFLMGDNRSHSTDSRDNRIGTVSGDSIVGKSIVRIYPLTKVGVVE
jgi:signal peptidase I